MGGFGNKRGGKIGREFKAGTKDNTRPSFKKERLNVQQTNALRKKVAESHHHTPRSPQKRTRMEAAVDLPCDVSSADAEPFAEPLSTVELMPRELRSAKNNNRKRKNYGYTYIYLY